MENKEVLPSLPNDPSNQALERSGADPLDLETRKLEDPQQALKAIVREIARNEPPRKVNK